MYEERMEKESCAKAAEEYGHDDALETAGQEKVKAVLLVGKCVLRETGNATTLDRLGCVFGYFLIAFDHYSLLST